MYCPNCGKDNSNEQRFCRSCGLSLQTISQVLVNEHSPIKSNDSLIENIKPEQRGWQNPLLYGFFMLSLGIIIIIFGKTMLGEQLIADIGTIIALLGIGLIGFKGVSLMLSSRSSSLPQSKVLSESEPTAKLPPASQFKGLPSVTEHTTHHLEPIHSERKAE
ncbi:MAG: zinc ribbon domain-containing protein [Blastocatellia bacterium]